MPSSTFVSSRIGQFNMETRKKLCSTFIREFHVSVDHDYGSSLVNDSSEPPACLLPQVWSFPILNTILEYCEVRTLKQCRLVCKAWNREAVRLLQRLTFIHVRNDSRDRIQDLVQLLEWASKEKSPCPFSQIHLSANNLNNEFVDLVMSETVQKQLRLVHFRLNPVTVAGTVDLAQNVYRILTGNWSSLTFFDCTLGGSLALNWDRKEEEDRPRIHLPTLKGLNFDDTDVPSFHSKWKDFIVEVVQGAPNLSALNVITFDDQLFNEIMETTDLSNLEEIFIQDFTPRHFHQFSTLKLPKLRTLHMDVVHISEENMMTSDDLKDIVKNFAETLQELSVNWATSSNIEGPFPLCPKLRQLTVDNWPGSLGLFNPRDLPLLDTLTVYEEIEGNVEIFLITDPHDGVYNVRWEGNPREETPCIETEEKRVYTIAYLSIQFPNLRCLDLTCAASDEMIRTIVTHLPLLEIFELMTECTLSEAVFTGINRLTLQHFLNAGISVEKCIRTTCLTDLQHLKKLAIHSYGVRGFPLTNNALAYGIGEMPALEFLHIDWTEDLDPQVILRNLNHLTSLVIKYYNDIWNPPVLLEMKRTMPQIKFDPELTDL